jgi:hypothetical protein
MFLLSASSMGQVGRHTNSRRPNAKTQNAPSPFNPGLINIFAGGGPQGTFANGDAATAVDPNGPVAVASDSQGNIYIGGDEGNTLYVVYEGGSVPPILAAVTTQTTPALTPIVGDIYQVTAVTSNCNYCYTDGLPASQLFLNGIQAMWFDSSDNLYIADNVNGYAIFEILQGTAVVHIVAGQYDNQNAVFDPIQGVPATSIQLSDPTDVKIDSFGNIYIADNGLTVAFVVYSGSQPPPVLAAEGVSTTPSDLGNIYTIAGQVGLFCNSVANGGPPCTDFGPANGSLLGGVESLSLDAAGNVYILDDYEDTVRVIYVGGAVPPLMSTVPNPQTGNLYTVAGLNQEFTPCILTPCGDGGTAQNMLLNSPLDMVIDVNGNVYIDDWLDFAIREIDAAGNVSTVAGIDDPNQITPALPTGGGPAETTQLNQPLSIAFDAQNNLYIADGGFDSSDIGFDIVWQVGSVVVMPQTITFSALENPLTYGVGQIPLLATATSRPSGAICRHPDLHSSPAPRLIWN